MFSSPRKGMDLEVKIKEAEIRMSVCPDSEIGKKNSVWPIKIEIDNYKCYWRI
jgi:hypothetical protein